MARGRPFTSEESQHLRALLAGGMPREEAAHACGMSLKTTHRLCPSHGTPARRAVQPPVVQEIPADGPVAYRDCAAYFCAGCRATTNVTPCPACVASAAMSRKRI
jgi:hypothetical protein